MVFAKYGEYDVRYNGCTLKRTTREVSNGENAGKSTNV